MDKVSKLMVFLIVVLTLPALLVAARPAETQKCEITGDIVSSPVEVEIGLGPWVLLVDVTNPSEPASLFLKGSLLQTSLENGDPTDEPYDPIVEDAESCRNADGVIVDCIDATGLGDYFEYYGHARVLKKNDRFDFEFGPLLLDGSVCRSVTYEDLPPPFGPPLCPYFLTIQDGLYVRTADKLTFDKTSWMSLVDYSVPDHVGYGPVGGAGGAAGITVQFLAAGGGDENEPEQGPKKCKDGVDNDWDGRIDCGLADGTPADPDCAKWCRP